MMVKTIGGQEIDLWQPIVGTFCLVLNPNLNAQPNILKARLSLFPITKLNDLKTLLLFWKLAFTKFNFPFERHQIFNISSTALQLCRHLLKNIFMLVFAFWLLPHVMVQEVSSKPPTQWCRLICLLQHFSGKWTICSPHNFLYLSQVCFLIVGSSLHAACVIEHSFLSLTFLLQNLLCWPFFFRKIWKLFLVAHFGFIFVLCILVDYSLFMPPSKERYKRSCPVVNLCEFFRQKPWSEFFCKRTPKKPCLIFWFSTWEPQLVL